MTEACAFPEVAEFRVSPGSPITPWLALLSAPLPATPAAPLTVPPTAPVVELATEPTVLPAPPTAPPADEVAPPTTPPRPPPPLDRPPPPEGALLAIPMLPSFTVEAATLTGGGAASS